VSPPAITGRHRGQDINASAVEAKAASRAKEREGSRKSRKPQARKTADRPLRRAASAAPRHPPKIKRQARQRNQLAALTPASQGEPVTPLVSGREVAEGRAKRLYCGLIQLTRSLVEPHIVEVWL